MLHVRQRHWMCFRALVLLWKVAGLFRTSRNDHDQWVNLECNFSRFWFSLVQGVRSAVDGLSCQKLQQ
jgi:hypothetical protein